MEPSHERSSEEWRTLSQDLVATGRRRGASLEDAEDRAQDAMLHLVRDQPDTTTAPSHAYAYQALRIANANEGRKRSRMSEIPRERIVALHDPENAVSFTEPQSEDVSERRILFMEMVDTVRDELGSDAMRMLLKSAAGYTEAEIEAERPDGSPTTGALRKKVARSVPQLTELLKGL